MATEDDRDQLVEFLTGAFATAGGSARAAESHDLADLRARMLNSLQPAFLTIHASDDDWDASYNKCSMRMLQKSPGAAQHSMLLRMQPGGEIPAHEHPVDEETFVVEGTVTFGSESLAAGDFHVAAAGTRHATMRSEDGAVLLISFRNNRDSARSQPE